MNLSGKRVVVMGLGHFGGGVGLSRFLVEQGAELLVTDLGSAKQLHASISQLADLPITYRMGEHRTSDFTTADLVVVNPAVDQRDNRFLQAAASAGIPITSEIRLLIQRLPNRARTIAITGTAGKSTVTSMIGHCLSKLIGPGNVHVGGNIGGSLLEKLDKFSKENWIVLELSSFMLEGLASDRWSPYMAVITNFFPNHLDRHSTIEAYRSAKQTILDFQEPHDIAILGPDTASQFHPNVPRVFVRELNDPNVTDTICLSIPGLHNQMNGLLAADAVGAALDIEWQRAAQSLEDYPGLPHRLEMVAERGGVRYMNDSKSTTPDAAKIALECFGQGIVHLIVGGYDKGSDMCNLAQDASMHCRAIYTIGATGNAIAREAEDGLAEVIRCVNINRAVEESARRVRSGEVVLLSPGCASWDQFDNYEKRGSAFIDAVLYHTS